MEKAKQSVNDLHQTIKEADVTPEQQATLDDISQHIDQFNEDPHAHHLTLRERLELALVDFEADHPSLSQAMQVAMYDLSNAGV